MEEQMLKQMNEVDPTLRGKAEKFIAFYKQLEERFRIEKEMQEEEL